MNKRTTLMLGLLLALFVLEPMVVTVNAQANGPNQPDMRRMPRYQRGNDGTVTIFTDIISIKANAEFPMFHFWYTNDQNGSFALFKAGYTTLIEFEDENADGAFQQDEVIQFASLSAYEWTLQVGTVEDNGLTTEIWLKYTKGAIKTYRVMAPHDPERPMLGTGAIETFEDVTLQIWAHVYLEDYSGEVVDSNGTRAYYLVEGGTELKMDIEIGNFPFSSETSMVAIQTHLHEGLSREDGNLLRHRFETRERNRNVTMTSDMNWNTEDGNETRFETMTGSDVQQIDMVDSITDVAQGFFRWVDTAVITWLGGEQEAVNVTASYVPYGTGLAVYLAYPNFDNGTLLHDPSIGVDENGTPLIGLLSEQVLVLGIGAVAIVALAAIVLRRR
ncbi:MAG: hypothetical protein EAX81_04510 [Candidatus Thorarchaeota archaeon]|nr:hypothetical protein [Candidatus Thorarchaeota archaeon]